MSIVAFCKILGTGPRDRTLVACALGFSETGLGVLGESCHVSADAG